MDVLSKVVELIRLFTSLLFKSIFTYGYIDGRRVPTLLNLAVLITQVFMARGGVENVLVVLTAVILTYVVRRSERAIIYSSTIALIPSIWYFIASLPFTLSPQTSALISLRVFTISLSTLCFIYFLNPVEVSAIIKSLRLGNAALFPTLTWKVIPHIMRDVETALLISKLKNVESWRSLATSILAAEEYTSLYEEGLHSKPEYRPSYEYSSKHTLITTLMLLSLITSTFWRP